jgi:predicted Zn-dependent protease with MMP-like domain
MLRIEPKRFDDLVHEALEALPSELQEKLENVDVVVEDRPSSELLREMGMDPKHDTLFGLYEGTPLPERSFDAAWELPGKVTIFREPLLEACESEEELVEEIGVTIVHEFAHFFGIDEATLEDLGWD